MHPSRGLIEDHGNGLRTITINAQLGRLDRADVLSHELVHDHHDFVMPLSTPEPLRQKFEHRVTVESDELMLPVADLVDYIRAKEDEPVSAWMVSEDFDVSWRIADRSLRRLLQKEAS